MPQTLAETSTAVGTRTVWALLSKADTQAMRQHIADGGVLLECYESASELAERVAQSDGLAPSVVLLDLDLLGRSIGFVLQIQKHLHRCHMVVLSTQLSSNHSAELLANGVPSLQKPVASVQLAAVMTRLCMGAKRENPSTMSSAFAQGSWQAHLTCVIGSYAKARGLSQQQQCILQRYLNGDGDKEIAAALGCSPATVYEHWRRMGRKAGSRNKQQVIADFHRFLAGA